MKLGVGQELVADGDGFVVLAAGLEGGGEADLVGRLRVDIDRGFEVGRGDVVLLAVEGAESQIVLRLRR